MIHAFADAATADVFNGANTRAATTLDKSIWPVVRRKLDMLNEATSVQDLCVPPVNRLEALKGDHRGRFRIRVNDQYRITFCFEPGVHRGFEEGNAFEVCCEDYHKQHRDDDGDDDDDSKAPAAGQILLEEFLKPLNLTKVEAAGKMGISASRLNELTRGKRGVTADTALRLAKLLKMTPEFWLNLQNGYDLHEATRAINGLRIEIRYRTGSVRGGAAWAIRQMLGWSCANRIVISKQSSGVPPKHLYCLR